MDFQDLAKKNFTIFFLGTLLTGFLAGLGVYQWSLRISNQETVRSERLLQLEQCEARLNSQAGQENIVRAFLKDEKIKVHLVDEAFKEENEENREAKHRISQIFGDIKDIAPFAVTSQIATKNSVEGFEANDIDSNVQVVIMHRHAFQTDSDSIVLQVLQNYLKKNPAAKYSIYSSTFNDETVRNNFKSELKNIGFGEGIVSLIYYPYSTQSKDNVVLSKQVAAELNQKVARLEIVKTLIALIRLH